LIVPKDFSPRPYQQIAVDFCYRQPFCALWAKPGMGKTSVVYSLLDLLKLAGSNFFPALVVAPKAVCELTWPAERWKWKQFHGLRVVSLLGTKPQREAALLERGDVYIINYDNIQWLTQRLGGAWPFKILVLDEATKVKGYRLSRGGKRSSALGDLVDKFHRVIELSGTPSPNGLKDLWGQIFFLDKGQRLGASYTAFLNRWFTVDRYTGEIAPRPNAMTEIYSAIADITLALRPEDWFDIDDPIFVERRITLPEEAQAQYDKLETEFFLQIGEDYEIDAVNAMALSTKLLQVASGTVYDNDGATVPIHDAKIDALRSITEESGGEPVLTVYQYRSQIAALQKAIPGTRVFKGLQDQRDWNAGKIQHMLIHPQSAGHGVDLQDGGRTMVFFTGTWNLEHRLQVIERIGPVRQIQSGHPRAVMIYDIIADGTLDDSVLSRMKGKATVQEALMAARAVRA
jgi:hypothetical protein